ncbi:MAG: translation initiation factor IF-3 [Mycoplasmoidaceae bacterium]
MKFQEKYLINGNIKVSKLLLINDDGEKLGEMSTNEALKMAESKNLDLVIISNKGSFPIAKILDFGKFLFEQKKKLKENLKKQTVVKNKEIKVKPAIGDHDLQVRVNNAIKWLEEGNRIRFVVLAYGRIGTKTDLIYDIYNKFIKLLDGHCEVQIELKKINNVQYESILIPIKKK